MGQVQRVAPPGAVSRQDEFRNWMENAVASRLAEVATKHLPADRLVRVALAAWNQNPKLRKCKRDSFLLSLLRAAQLGLDPSGALGQAYLVPYGDTCNLIIGYRGLIALARRSGEIETIEAHVVFDKDNFVYRLGLDPKLEHEPHTTGPRGKVVAAYAIARFKGGGHQVEVMFRNDIDAIMARTKGGGRSGPWRDHYPEMARKTVVRRLSKFLPLNAELAAAVEYDGEAEFRGPLINITPADPDDSYHEANADNGSSQLPAPKPATPRHALLSILPTLQSEAAEAFKAVVGRRNPFSASDEQLSEWIKSVSEWSGEVAESEPSVDREAAERQKLVESLRAMVEQTPGLSEALGIVGTSASELGLDRLVALNDQAERLLADWPEERGEAQ